MPITFKTLSRKQWIIAGLILTVIVLGIFVLLLNRFGGQTAPNADINEPDISELAYCNEDQVKPCVVSFGLDADNNMLVNFLLPELSYPEFYLRVTRGDINIAYECQKLTAALNNAFCIGEKLPPGESLHLMLISSEDDAILAQGNLSILGLAFPTLDIVTPTDSPTGTLAPDDPRLTLEPTDVPTETPDFILPTSTQFETETATPNSSYP